jgi:putative endonuclease
MHQTPNVGELGEQLVADWLGAQNWIILHHRWRCRWGEIDLIAQHQSRERGGDSEQVSTEDIGKWRHRDTQNSSHSASLPLRVPKSFLTPSPLLAFVEVKTRSRGNWDTDGLLAITLAKQTKLRKTAELFLAEHPNLATLPCRFDVALVSCKPLSQRSCRNNLSTPSTVVMDTDLQVPPVQLGQPRVVAGYQLSLQDYIQSAFD